MLILYYLVGYVQYIINMHGLACTETCLKAVFH
jgi:hypothetical protein